MKKFILIAAACAMFAACAKTGPETVTPATPAIPAEGSSFEKGQKVTLNVNTGSTTKATSELNGDGQTVDFKWADGDKIKVTVAGAESEFKLMSGAGESSAVFEGVMPASGDQFDVQYPVTDPDIATQAYSTEPIPHDKMLFTATGVEISEGSFELKAQYAALRLNLYGAGQTISKIVVTNTSSTETPKPSYTLNIEDGKTIGATSDAATPFFIVVPAGTYKFSAEVFNNAATSSEDKPSGALDGLFTVAGNIFTPSKEQTFTAGEILNMPSKEVVFPTKVRFSKGNLKCTREKKQNGMQWTYIATWGFYENQYEINSLNTDSSRKVESTDTEIDLFTWGYGGGWSTTPGTQSYGSSFTDWGTTIDNKGTWRTLTSAEWQYLFDYGDYSNETRKGLYAYGVTVVGKENCVVLYPDGFTGTKVENGDTNSYATAEGWSSAAASGVVCLPAAGYRNGSEVKSVGADGYYWSSTACGEGTAYRLNFGSGGVYTGNDGSRAVGCSVRLVTVAN